MNLSVFGLGYVGTVTAACLAEMGHRVIGVDINEAKLDLVERGVSPVIEKDLPELIRRGVGAGRLSVTASPGDAVAESQVSLVCVGTPSAANGSLCQDAVENVMREIGEAIRRSRSERHLIVLRSTVLPGTCESLVLRVVEEASGLTGRDDFGLVYNPEFLREGTSVEDFFHPPQTIVGAWDDGDVAVMQDLYSGVEAPFVATDVSAAEMIKYVCNPFHALKVAFANEIGALCRARGIDAHKVMDLFLSDHKLNLSAAYLRPGYAFGGSCLPKDLRALVYCAKESDLELPLLSSVLPSNEVHLQRGIEAALRFGRKKIGLVGLSFKPGTDDLRESPYVRLAEALLGKGMSLRIYDPRVSMARLTGANRRYIEGEIPHIAELLVETTDELLEFAEVILLSRSGDVAREILPRLLPDQILVDLVALRDGSALCAGRYVGITTQDHDPVPFLGAELGV